MTKNKTGRRTFIKQIAFFSLCFGLEPKILLQANEIEINQSVLSEIDDLQQKYKEGIKAIFNVKSASSMSAEELKQQYIKSVKLAAKSSMDPSVSTNENTSNVTGANTISKDDIKVIYGKRMNLLSTLPIAEQVIPILIRPLRKKYSSIDDAASGLGIGYQIGKTGTYGTICAVGAFSPLRPFVIPACFEFFTSAVSIYDQYQQVQGNKTRTQKNLGSASLSAVNVLSENLYKQLSTNPNYKFDIPKDFAFKVNTSDINLRDVFPRSSSPAEDRLNKALFDQNSTDVTLKIEGMDTFFNNFLSELGDIQQDFLQTKIEAEEHQREEEINDQRERALLYSSVGQLLGIFASKVMGPTEAKLFNNLMPLAAQFALAGAIGPMGWATIGITIANTLLSSGGSGGMNEIILKALAQIQKQLEVINSKLDQIYETQLKVLDGINLILKEIQQQGVNINARLDVINADLDRVYERINTAEIQSIENDYQDNLRIIYNLVIKKLTTYPPNTLVSSLDKLVGTATSKLDDAALTKFQQDVTFDGSKLVREIYPDNTDFGISLYDSIGLISAASNYSPNKRESKADLPIVHPVTFYRICGQIIDYLILSDLENNSKNVFAKNLLAKAIESKKNINKCCDKEIIVRKIDDYLFVIDDALSSFRDKLNDLHEREFEKKDDSRKYFRLNAVDKNYLNGNETVFGFNPEFITQISGGLPNFKTDKFDDLLLNIALDSGLVTKLSRESTGKFHLKEKQVGTESTKHNFRIKKGDLVGSKKNKITLGEKVILKYNKNKYLELRLSEPLSFEYSVYLYADSIQEITKHCRYGDRGFGVSCVYTYLVNRVTSKNEFKDIKWQQSVKESLRKNNIDIDSVLPNYEAMNFHDFLNHLLDQYFLDKKQDFIEQGIKHIKEGFSKKIDGTGISLMVLSKLNQVVTGSSLIPYEIDYKNEIFKNSDFVETLYFYLSQNRVEKSELQDSSRGRFIPEYQEIIKEWNDSFIPSNLPENKLNNAFFLKNGEKQLEPASFIDLMCISLKRRAIKTAESCRDKSIELTENDCEPYLADTINTLNWLSSFYLNDSIS